MRLRLPALLLLVVLGAAACGDDSGSSATTTTAAETTTTAAPVTTAAPTTTAAPATTAPPATVTPAPQYPTDPAEYANAFVEAWSVGDQARALELGSQDAVDTIFAYDSGGPGQWTLQQCEGAAGSSYCTFSAGGDPTIVVQVGNEAASQAQPQAVTSVQIQSP